METPDAFRIVLCAAVVSLLTSSLEAADAPPAFRRIRLLRPCVPTLIADAAAVSPTIRVLLDRLQRSDVIVYVRCAAFLPPSIAGRLLFLGAAAAHRYVLIEIRMPAIWQLQAAVVAHELQHAIEIAEARGIRSLADMADHYARAGIQVGGREGAFETEAARRTGRRVLRELPLVPAVESARMRESRGDPVAQR